jgi:serine/threonine protein kinase
MVARLSPPAKGKNGKGKLEAKGRYTRHLDPKRRTLNKSVENIMLKPLKNDNVAPKRGVSRSTPDEWIAAMFGSEAKFLSSGKYGRVYKLNLNKTASKMKPLKNMLTNVVETDRVPQSGTFIVKVGTQGKKDWAPFVLDNVHESQAHRHLTTRCVSLKCAARPVCARDISPKFYFGGADPTARLFITVMEFVNGDTLYKYLSKRSNITASTYLAIEKAIVTMWLTGIVHGDLHEDNIMISPNGSKAWVIDFGFAVVLPPNRLEALKRVMDDVPNVSESLANSVWYAKNALQGYVNSVLAVHRGMDWYNADGKLLRGMYLKVPANQRSQIKALRRKLWGCKPKPGLVKRCIKKLLKRGRTQKCEQEQVNPNPNRKLTFAQRKNLRKIASPAVAARNKEAARKRLKAHRIL